MSMKRIVPVVSSRLWTCSEEARSLLAKSTAEDMGTVLLQSARVADSVVKAKGNGERVRRFRISTETVDRHGDVIRSKGIQLKNFRKNPVVLFAHDSRMPPIGKSPKVEIGEGLVEADVDFFDAETYPFADTIFRIVQAGGLKATSIGFIPIKFERLPAEEGKDDIPEWMRGIDFQKVELLEFSIVPIPANPEAVGKIAKSGALMKPYLEWLDDIQDNWSQSEPVLADLGVGEEDVQAVRKAVDTSTSVLVNKGEDEPEEDTEEEEQEAQAIALTAGNDGSICLADEHEGEFPARILVSAELVAEAANKYVHHDSENNLLFFDLTDATAEYTIESQDGDGTLTCTLLKTEQKDDVDDEVEVEVKDDDGKTGLIDGEFAIYSVSGRKKQWKDINTFLEWAKEEGYDTSNVRGSRQFWHLSQEGVEFNPEGVTTISLHPKDAEPDSEGCLVQATLVRIEDEPEDEVEEQEETPVESAFQAGDVVELKSGGPAMTVERCSVDGVTAAWLVGGVVQSREFNPAMLVLFEDEPEVTGKEASSKTADELLVELLHSEEFQEMLRGMVVKTLPDVVTGSMRKELHKATGVVD